ncbi:uncharacterized protein I303_101163 [Kwoniella dejecticola CBS 10117]|uniref:OTU domain-containing protein n=1 Tax=Kwoniella dejecticola CBS 10117 TaxID=1296121 RepID=A0A1A6AH62_9TREE|nr:uncharacterized protein I303_01170 [Kwoniella dejecticola CBS 10117]OBR89343.1 hypothetical protein I303_01170 [Kwoniella dejecticola CBS 10117]
MGLLPLLPSPPLSTTPGSEADVLLQPEAGPSKLPQTQSQSNLQLHLQSKRDQDTVVTPPTSPLAVPLLGTRKRKRRNGAHLEDAESTHSGTTSDGDFLPSPAPSASTSASASTPGGPTGGTRALRGGGKRQSAKARKQSHAANQALPNSQESSYSATTNTGRARKHQSGGEGGAGSRRTTRSKAKRAFSPSDLVTTSLEEIAIEEAAVKAEIARLGLALRDVKGDGNCLFRVLSDQGFGGEKRHNEIRRLVCDYLETHKDVMEGFVVPFMKDGEGYEGYVTRMRQLKQFGSHIEIQAAARVFKRNIRVVMSTTSFTIPWQTEATTYRDPPETPSPADVGPVPLTPSHRTRSKTIHTPHAPSISLPESLPSVGEDRSMLWLALFSQAEHFQSIRRMGDREHGPAEIEDRLSIPHARDVSEAARRERGELVDDKKTKTPLSLSSKISQVLNSLPPDHGISPANAENILGRTHGDIGEAVELLLDDINQEKETATGVGSESGSSDHVEQMLLSPNPNQYDATTTLLRISHAQSIAQLRSKTPDSPSNTATTSTESRSHSRSRSNSGASTQSGNTSQTEAFDDSSAGNTSNLSKGIKDMTVDSHTPSSGQNGAVTGVSPDARRSRVRPGPEGERRRSARLGTVGVGAW